MPRLRRVLLESEEAPSHYGSRLFVDRCGACGGVFTSWGKLIALAPGVVAEWAAQAAPAPSPEIDTWDLRSAVLDEPVSTPSGQQRSRRGLPARRTPSCPVCLGRLVEAKASQLPAPLTIPDGLALSLCSAGHGFWLSTDALGRFKEFQTETLERKRTDYLDRAAHGAERRARMAAVSFRPAHRAEPARRIVWSSVVVLIAFLALAVTGIYFLSISVS